MAIAKKITPARVAGMTKAAAARGGNRRRLGELKQAMGDFDDIEVAEPAVKPEPEVRKAIRKAVRAYYRRDALERT